MHITIFEAVKFCCSSLVWNWTDLVNLVQFAFNSIDFFGNTCFTGKTWRVSVPMSIIILCFLQQSFDKMPLACIFLHYLQVMVCKANWKTFILDEFVLWSSFELFDFNTSLSYFSQNIRPMLVKTSWWTRTTSSGSWVTSVTSRRGPMAWRLWLPATSSPRTSPEQRHCWSAIRYAKLDSSKKVQKLKFHRSYFSYYHTSNIVFDIIRKPVYLSLNWYHICNGYEIMESTLQLVLIESQKWNLAKHCVLAILFRVVGGWKQSEFPCWATLMNCKISFLTFTHIQLYCIFHNYIIITNGVSL